MKELTLQERIRIYTETNPDFVLIPSHRFLDQHNIPRWVDDPKVLVTTDERDEVIKTLISEKLGVEIDDYEVKSFTTEGKRTKLTIAVKPVNLKTYIDLNYTVKVL